MNLKDKLDAFYYSSAMCDLKLMNENNTKISYNSLLYLEIINYLKGECTASKLAKILCISKPGVTMKINELIKQNLIIKIPDTKDKRKIYLKVNEETVPQIKVFRNQDNRAITKINNEFTKEDIEKFCKMLSIIVDINLEDIE